MTRSGHARSSARTRRSSALGLVAALVLGRPELVALTAPFLLALGAGLALRAAPQFDRRDRRRRRRAVEGDEIDVRITLAAVAPVDRLDVFVQLPHGLERRRRRPSAESLRLARGERRELELRCARRAGARTGSARCTSARATRSASRRRRKLSRTRGAPCLSARGHAAADRCSPRETQLFAGNEVARRKGEGIEFADMRPWAPGDPLKRVNWRASARRGELWVNESHPERNTDVILFVDSFAEARGQDAGTLDLAVRATAALADAYVGRRDRVGLIVVRRHPALAAARHRAVQLYRIVDALLDTQIILSYYWKEST